MIVEYILISKDDLTDEIREIFSEALIAQGKVQGNTSTKADRCKTICLAKVSGKVVGIGGVKCGTSSDFSVEKANLLERQEQFTWELGYIYTYPNYTGKNIAKTIATKLVESSRMDNLMASTEITKNPAMVKILESLGFERHGKAWPSNIHRNELGLFLKYNQ